MSSNGDKRDEEVRELVGDEVRESGGGGEDIGSVPDSTATLVYEREFFALLRSRPVSNYIWTIFKNINSIFSDVMK